MDSACLGLRIEAVTSQCRMGSRREREKRRRGRGNQPCFQLLPSPVPQWIHNVNSHSTTEHTLISLISTVIYGATIGAQPCARCGGNKQELVLSLFLGAGSSEKRWCNKLGWVRGLRRGGQGLTGERKVWKHFLGKAAIKTGGVDGALFPPPSSFLPLNAGLTLQTPVPRFSGLMPWSVPATWGDDPQVYLLDSRLRFSGASQSMFWRLYFKFPKWSWSFSS